MSQQQADEYCTINAQKIQTKGPPNYQVWSFFYKNFQLADWVKPRGAPPHTLAPPLRTLIGPRQKVLKTF